MMEILYSDPDILVISKPAGVLSEGEGPDCLPVLLAQQCGGQVFPVHRLDRGAAGLMVFARSSGAAAALSRSIQQGALTKEYLAVVAGAPQGDEGEMEDWLFKDSRKGKVFAVSRPRKGVRQARLSWRLVQTGGQPRCSLVRIRLDTGRTHQIRVQFSSRGMPLHGDGKYGSRVKGELALFSCRLAFPHPKDGRAMELELLPPMDRSPWRDAGDQTFSE